MVQSNPASNQGASRTSRLIWFVPKLSLLVTITCVVATFVGYALGFTEQLVKNNSEPSRALVWTERVDHLDKLAREPMVVELSDGTLFVSGYDGDLEKSPNLWRSRDHGATWEGVNVGSKADGAIGNSDVDLAVGRDDTLYFVTMSFDIRVNEGTRVTVGVSKDKGATWWAGCGPDSRESRCREDMAEVCSAGSARLEPRF